DKLVTGVQTCALPIYELQVAPFPCGCGRTWGCIEVYTTLSGLPHLLADRLAKRPDHALATSPLSLKERALTLRGLAQNGDSLAEIGRASCRERVESWE